MGCLGRGGLQGQTLVCVLQQMANMVSHWDEGLEGRVRWHWGILAIRRKFLAPLELAWAALQQLWCWQSLLGPALFELWVQIAVNAEM